MSTRSALRSAAFAALASASLAAVAPSAKRVLHVRLDPGNYVDAATTVDASGAPTFVFGTGDVPPSAATVYDGAGQLRWSFFNKSEGRDVKLFETTAARHCESGGKGAGAVDIFVTEADTFNGVGFTVFGLSSAADSAAPVWTLPIAGCEAQDGGFTTKASDTGARIVVLERAPRPLPSSSTLALTMPTLPTTPTPASRPRPTAAGTPTLTGTATATPRCPRALATPPPATASPTPPTATTLGPR